MRLSWPEERGVVGVGALSTDRQGGVSGAPFESLNLGLHVGDEPEAVEENRRRVREAAGGAVRFAWLEQVHGVRVVDAATVSGAVEADGSVSRTPGVACVVMTADCLPVLFCDRAGTVVGAAHAGWRGLVAGILEATVEQMGVDPGEILAWLGPAIGPGAFEVGPEVREAFLERDQGAAGCFRPSPANSEDRWVADLYGLARRRLWAVGVEDISGGGACTFEGERYFSYRRDGRTGRMASAIWIKEQI